MRLHAYRCDSNRHSDVVEVVTPCPKESSSPAIADRPQPRARLFGLEQAKPVNHSEEHLTLETDRADSFAVGDCCYAVPAHICPTVALHDIAWVVRDGRAAQSWEISARRRSLGV